MARFLKWFVWVPFFLVLVQASDIESNVDPAASSNEDNRDLFNVFLIQKTDGTQELCIPMNFTQAFSRLAEEYNEKERLAKKVAKKKSRKRPKRGARRLRKLMVLKRVILKKLLQLQ